MHAPRARATHARQADAAGWVDATGLAARFDSPIGVAVDGAGTIYVADEHNNRIRKVTPAGVVSTLSGSGVAAFADGPPATAGFYNPVGVVLDAAGNLYVGGFYESRIRRVTIAGVASTLAGTDPGGFMDGPGATALFNYPYGVAVDAARTVYVADYYGHRIRKVTTVGIGELTATWSVRARQGRPPSRAIPHRRSLLAHDADMQDGLADIYVMHVPRLDDRRRLQRVGHCDERGGHRRGVGAGDRDSELTSTSSSGGP